MVDDSNNKYSKEDDDMNTISEKQGYARIDYDKLNFGDKSSKTEEALREVTPFQWSEEVLKGHKKVIIKKSNDK